MPWRRQKGFALPGETDDALPGVGRPEATSSHARPWTHQVEALFSSAALVAPAEIGDKTQLLAIVLAARFKRPWPIIAGILVATILNHGAAATLGYYLGDLLTGQPFRLAVGFGFVTMALWTLVPDKEDAAARHRAGSGVFVTTAVTFFIVEIGDKTQIATTLLAARFHDILLVTIGTTIGMMLANVPAVVFGEAVTRIVPLTWVRVSAACLFALLGGWIIFDAAVSMTPRH